MKITKISVKILAALGVISAIVSFVVLSPSQGFYSSFLYLIVVIIWPLEFLWPGSRHGFKVSLQKIPLAIRFFYPILCALLAFMDIKTTKEVILSNVWLYIMAGFTAIEILSPCSAS